MKTIDSKILAGQRYAAFTRRHFLHGLGACLALPAFVSFRGWRTEAADLPGTGEIGVTPSGAPLRAAFLSFPNGSIPDAWWPDKEGRDFPLSKTLEPLAPVRQHLQLLAGLDHKNANPGPDGAGDHARGSATFLTGVRLKKSATDVHAGISIDQVLARRAGHLTRFPSLELTCDGTRNSGACDSGYACAYQYNISWSSPTTPMSPEANPKLVFERLFGAGAPGERAENFARRQMEQRSILDFVLDDARDLQKRLDGRDRDKLDQYLTGVREIEQRIQAAERFGPIKDPGVETPAGIPHDYADHVELMYDLLFLAFQTDSTRVATFLLAHDGSNRPFKQIGVPEGHHDLSHHFNNPEKMHKVAEIDRWYVTQLARFLSKLDSTADVDGQSLLHNSMILYGSGNADGNRHTHTNLPIILAGNGGGSLQPGRFIRHPSQPASNLFLSLADGFGLRETQHFGDATGRLDDV